MKSTRNRIVMLAATVTVMVACALASRGPAPEPLQVVGYAAESPTAGAVNATTENQLRPLEPELRRPETTTVIIPSRAIPREERLPQPISITGERLVWELQRELKRVGCYSHEINGQWTPATRRAMKDFTERVNAVLPVDTPDAVLLALLGGHTGIACGSACAAGQSLTKDDRCVPIGLLAVKTKKPQMTEMAPPPIPAPPGTPVARVRRSVAHRTTSGSGFFRFLGW